MDKQLFIYVTKSTGYTLAEAAEAMGLCDSSLCRRLNGNIPFRVCEIEAWMKLTGTVDAGPIFFPSVVACKQQKEAGSNV